MSTLSNYRALIRASLQFTDYNFKNYFLRKIRAEFRNPEKTYRPEEISSEIKKLQNLAAINKMFAAEPTVAEKPWNL